MWRKYDWPALAATFALIVVVRESCVWLTGLFNHPELGNLLGLLLLLGALLLWRRFKAIPMRLIDANAHIMKESAFAFLPVCGGSVILLLHLGSELPGLLFILVFTTLLAMWVYAHIAKRWI